MGILLDMDIENGDGGGRQVGGRQGGAIHIVPGMGVLGTQSLRTTQSPPNTRSPQSILNFPSSLSPRGIPNLPSSPNPLSFLSLRSAPNLRRFLSLLEMNITTCRMVTSHTEDKKDILNIPHMRGLGVAIVLNIMMTAENISGVHRGGLEMADLLNEDMSPRKEIILTNHQTIHHPGETTPPEEGIAGHPYITPIMDHLDVDITTLQAEVIVRDVIPKDERNSICTGVSGLRTREATITRLGGVAIHIENLGMTIPESIALTHRPSTESPENPGTATQATHTIHTTHHPGINCLSMRTRFFGNGCEVLHGWEYSYFTLLRFMLMELLYSRTLAPPKPGLSLTLVE